MTTALRYENGIIAILDALGAATYSDVEIKRFLRSREIVIELLNQQAEDVLPDVTEHMITTFTFNDTVLIILKTQTSEPSLKDISKFFTIMRKFLVDSLQHRILFRGSISIGSFYVNESTNTVMGEAVIDAAAWYDKAEWIGVHATPKATMLIQRQLERFQSSRPHLFVDYDVPLKRAERIKAIAVNWPKVFFADLISPCASDETPREKLLEFLTQHRVPKGTEQKFFNTLQFYDVAAEQIEKMQKQTKRSNKNR